MDEFKSKDIAQLRLNDSSDELCAQVQTISLKEEGNINADTEELSPGKRRRTQSVPVTKQELANTSASSKSEDSEVDDAGSNDDDDSNDGGGTFEPVVPLPPLVHAADEDMEERTIVEYRVKLYRFECSTKEWKAKGVGNIKLLQSKDDPKKSRVVMWRAGVGKLACNFRLFPGIGVTNFQDNPKILCWKCFDSSMGNEWETFTCRFQKEENSIDFKNKMLKYATESASDFRECEATGDIPCPGCRGCDPDAFKFPETVFGEVAEPLIDYPLAKDSCNDRPTLLVNRLIPEPCTPAD